MDLNYIDSDIKRLSDSLPNNTSGKVFFIGPPNGGAKIRQEVGTLSQKTIANYLTDLGNITHKGFSDLTKILPELQEQFGLLFICLSSGENISKDILCQYVNPVIIHNSPSDEYEDHACLGIQKHLLIPNFDLQPHKHFRLGELQNNLEKAEVVLRSSDIVWVNLNAIRLSDNLGNPQSSNAGFTTEQFCTIAKFAGASTQLKCVILTGYDENNDPFGMTAKNIALFTFYLLEGLNIRISEGTGSEEYQKYSVVHNHSSAELVFVENQRSGRWWVELYSEDAEKEVRIACTKQDYEEACNNQISDRLTSVLALI